MTNVHACVYFPSAAFPEKDHRLIRLQSTFLMLRIVGQHNLSGRFVQKRTGSRPFRPVAEDRQDLFPEFPSVGIDPRVVFQQGNETAVHHHILSVAQFDQPPVIVIHTVRIPDLVFRIDFQIIPVDLNPGCPGCKGNL